MIFSDPIPPLESTNLSPRKKKWLLVVGSFIRSFVNNLYFILYDLSVDGFSYLIANVIGNFLRHSCNDWMGIVVEAAETVPEFHVYAAVRETR